MREPCAALKTERVHEAQFRTRAEAKAVVFESIEVFTIGSACTRPWATERRLKLAPAWRRSLCERRPDLLIYPLHSQGGGPLRFRSGGCDLEQSPQPCSQEATPIGSPKPNYGMAPKRRR